MNSVEALFSTELIKDERILWSGQPDPKLWFTSADVFLIPFSILWGGFAIFWEAAVLGLIWPNSERNDPPLFFLLWGVPFVLFGLYLIAGRFIYKVWRKRHTYYAVTDRRVLAITTGRRRTCLAAFIDTIPTINKSLRSNGTGTLIFGNRNLVAAMYANTGLEFFGGFYGQDAPAFFDIPDANRVYELVSSLRRGGRST